MYRGSVMPITPQSSFFTTEDTENTEEKHSKSLTTKVTKDFKAESKTRCASSNRETTHTGYCALNQNQFFVELRVLRGEGFLRIMPLCPLCPLGLRKIFL